MRFRSPCLVAALLFPAQASAQDLLTWLSNRANIQQVIKDKSSTDKPAFLSLTFPKDLPAQKDASIAAEIDLVSTPTLKLGPFLEYIEKSGAKPQDQFTAGINTVWLVGLGRKDNVGGVAVSRRTLRNETEVKYKNDSVAKTRGLSAATRLTLIGPAKSWRWGPYLIVPSDGQLGLKWEPRIGLEYDNVIHSNSATPQGSTLRTYAEIGLYLYPFGQSLQHRLVLSFTYAYRSDIAAPAGTAKADHNLRTYSALVYLDPDGRFALGLDRVSGQDPSNGFVDQNLVRVSLKVRIKS